MTQKSKLLTTLPALKDGQQKTFNGKNGKTYYVSQLIFENKDTGEVFQTTPEPTEWKQGEEYEYIVEQGKYGNRIRKPYSEGTGNRSSRSYGNQETHEEKSRVFGMAYAKDIYCNRFDNAGRKLDEAKNSKVAQAMSVDQMFILANEMFNYMNTGTMPQRIVERLQHQQQAQKPKNPIPEKEEPALPEKSDYPPDWDDGEDQLPFE
jgi:hypothetical protein